MYLHIPFCARKCSYCDFRSFGNSGEAEQKAYIGALCREIREYKTDAEDGAEEGTRAASSYGIAAEENGAAETNYNVDSIFFGGGTPSLLEPLHIAAAMNALSDSFHIDPDAEITIEANPGTLTAAKLKQYRLMGINRLSLGVQSMDDSVLFTLGRIHTRSQVLDSVRLAREAGFDNINIDLMLGIPGQTLESWERTMDEIFGLEPEHLSFYSLQIEEGTPFYDWFRTGRLEAMPEELDRRMYHGMRRRLEDQGYRHYEISNAAKPGRECRHNLKYWSMQDYIGLGLAAHSYVRGVRFSNTEDMERYLRGDHLEEVHKNDRADSISDYLFTELRRIEGFSQSEFEERFGEPPSALFGPEIRRFCAEGLLEADGDRLRFTARGLDFTNTVLRELMTAGETETHTGGTQV